jgi:hypothetical protein
MDLAWDIKLVWFGALLILLTLVHWKLAFGSLEDLVEREKVLGGRKAPWALGIIFITYFGSIMYMLAHSQTKPEPEADEWVIRRYK